MRGEVCLSCRYEPFLVAETAMDGQEASSASSSSVYSPAGKGDGAFSKLARFTFGGNASGARMQMTAPVLSDSRGRMRFVIEPSYKVWEALPLGFCMHACRHACLHTISTVPGPLASA